MPRFEQARIVASEVQATRHNGAEVTVQTVDILHARPYQRSLYTPARAYLPWQRQNRTCLPLRRPDRHQEGLRRLHLPKHRASEQGVGGCLENPASKAPFGTHDLDSWKILKMKLRITMPAISSLHLARLSLFLERFPQMLWRRFLQVNLAMV